MVTVVKNPTGHKIIDQVVTGEVTDSGGDALIVFPYHSLGTGDYIYAISDIEDYNGFWYVTVIDANSFKISEYDGAGFVGFEQEISFDYYQTNSHEWSSIFLPIVYKLSNDRWPVNTVDTARSVSSFTDDNGYTNLNLSGALRSSFNALEFVEISGASDELNGVWQIVEVVTTSDITIDLPYHIDNNFSGATVQYYYNNYQVKVKVFGGLPTSHPWYTKKPFVEVAELSLTPDENNLVTFSVSDYIKGKVAIKNNLLIASYPLNLDAFTAFYISHSEEYDISDNYSLSTIENDFSVDSFEGYAVAGKLPFKNAYSGHYSDYVLTSGSPAHWLTAFSRLFAIEDLYFDISFIKNVRGEFWIIIDKYVSDYLTLTEVVPYTDQGVGVYRIPIEVSSVYDSFCVHAYTPGSPSTAGVPATTLADINDWEDKPGGQTWGGLVTSVNGSGGISDYLLWEIVTAAGFSYEFTTSIDLQTNAPTEPIFEIIWALLDASYNVVDTVTFNYTTAGVKTETFDLISTTDAKYLGLFATNNTPFDTKQVEVTAVAYNSPGAVDDSVDAQVLTEEICIDIMQACAPDIEGGDTPEEDFFRLLETGFFRLLEDGDRRLLEEAP